MEWHAACRRRRRMSPECTSYNPRSSSSLDLHFFRESALAWKHACKSRPIYFDFLPAPMSTSLTGITTQYFFCSQILCILQQKRTNHQFRKTKKASKKCFFTFSPADLGKSVPSVRACSVKFLRPPLKVREKSGGDVFNATSSSSLEIFSLFLLSTLKSCFPPCRSFASAVGLGHLKGGRFSRA